MPIINWHFQVGLLEEQHADKVTQLENEFKIALDSLQSEKDQVGGVYFTARLCHRYDYQLMPSVAIIE